MNEHRPAPRTGEDPGWWPLPSLDPRDLDLRDRGRRLDMDVDSVERDLVRLVLTVVELLRQLMERQAMRKVDDGLLTEEQEERVGLTLMLLEDRMERLRDHFGLTPADLNLDLGPLGTLLPRS
jgi:hypothetical protein